MLMAHKGPSIRQACNQTFEGGDLLALRKQLYRPSLDDSVGGAGTDIGLREITGHERQSPTALGIVIIALMDAWTQSAIEWTELAERYRVVIAAREH
jgi:hypothetical protein